MNENQYIYRKLRVKDGDPLPHTGRLLHEFNRINLAETFKELGYKVGAEIGVWKGEYSEVLCKTIPGLKLFCIDPWLPKREGSVIGDYNWRKTRKRLAAYDVHIIRKKSCDALVDIQDGSLDFVYIDAAHDFDNVIFDIIEWSKKVRVGGIVAGHDYLHIYDVGVVFAVDSYTNAHNINPWFVTTELLPSWFFVKG